MLGMVFRSGRAGPRESGPHHPKDVFDCPMHPGADLDAGLSRVPPAGVFMAPACMKENGGTFFLLPEAPFLRAHPSKKVGTAF